VIPAMNPSSDLPTLIPIFGDPSLGFGNRPRPAAASTVGSVAARFPNSISLPTTVASTFSPSVGFGSLTSSFDALTLDFDGLTAAANQTNAGFLKRAEEHRLDRKRGLYQVVGAATAFFSVAERTVIAPTIAVENAVQLAANEPAGGGCRPQKQ